MERIPKRKPISELPYSPGLMAQSFWFVEFRNLVQLIVDKTMPEEIRRICVDENLFGLRKARRIKDVYVFLRNRAAMLDDDGMRLLLDGDIGTQKLVNLVAIARGDRLLFEFLYEVYRNKLILGQETLAHDDAIAFFHRKDGQSDTIRNWNDGTKTRLTSMYFKFMAEAGLVRVEGKNRRITAPMVSDALREYLVQSKDLAILAAITGGAFQ